MIFKVYLTIEVETKDQMDTIFASLIDAISKAGVIAGGGFALQEEESEDEQEDD